jgi:hypothetical protein
MTQKPEASKSIWTPEELGTVELVSLVLSSVPFGSVPLSTIVLVPFTSAMLTRLLFNDAALPFPRTESM